MCAALLLLGTAIVVASPAGAAESGGPEPLFQIPEGSTDSGTGAGQLFNPRGIATNPSNGHIYVAEPTFVSLPGNERISEFTPWGEFVKAYGWGVQNGNSEFQTCIATCQAGIKGSGAGQFDSPQGLAVDAAGNVYVFERKNLRVQKFNAAGQFLLMFGGEVNKTTGEDVCTKAQLESANVCGAGIQGTANSEFSIEAVAGVEGSYIAIGSGGTVYVGDKGRIQEFEPNGAYKAQIALPMNENPGSLASDPSTGDLYFSFNQKIVEKKPGLYKFNSAGTLLGVVSIEAPEAIAVDHSGNVYAVNDPAGTGLPSIEARVLEFDSSGSKIAEFDEAENAELTALATNTVEDVYVANFGKSGSPRASFINAYGPPPNELEPPPVREPQILTQYAASVSTTSAILKAQINPRFFDKTTYYVEYGLADCEVNVCANRPAAPGISLTTKFVNGPVTTAGVSVPGLTPGATYHYRFVAISGGFTVKGPDQVFVARRGGASTLPDDRAYERVSPADKNNGEVATPQGSTGGAVENGLVRPQQAAPTGEAITYASFTPFGNAVGAPGTSQYISRRTSSGWVTENVTPSARGGKIDDPLRGFSSDLSKSAVVQKEPLLAAGASAGFQNLYLRDGSSGSFQTLTTEVPKITGIEQNVYCVGYLGASNDFGHVIFMANGALTSNAPASKFQSLYEWSPAGLSLVSILPNGNPATPFLSTGFGAGAGQGENCSVTETIVRHAISADGSRIFWTYGGKFSGASSPLMARVNRTETVELDLRQGGSGPAGDGKFWAASADGSKVFFTAPGKLTPNASAGDLYRYDFNSALGSRLTDITVDPTPGSDPADVRGVLGASEDGSRVYFVGNGNLTGSEVNDEGQQPQAGQPNLYAWSATESLRFIATLSTSDVSNWGGTPTDPQGGLPEKQTSRVSPDGLHLAFLSADQDLSELHGYVNLDQGSGKPDNQAYLYDIQAGEMSCVSCNPTGARPIGPAMLPTWPAPFEQPRYLSDDGGRLFFESFDALDLRDTNGRRDVYEFERESVGGCSSASPTFDARAAGCLYLISTGSSGDETYLLDASADGRDVFLSTRQKLVLDDKDERFDVYDARAGGGFAQEPPAPTPCGGEACRPSQSPPAVPSPGSSSFSGSGNVKNPSKCPKGKHRVKRHGKSTCAKNQKKKQGHQKRRAVR